MDSAFSLDRVDPCGGPCMELSGFRMIVVRDDLRGRNGVTECDNALL